MNVEQTLTTELQTVAGLVTAPPPPAPGALVRRAEQTRTRTRVRRIGVIGLVAAAVAAAIALGSQVGHPKATPSPVRPTQTQTADALPTGALPRVPYLVGEGLYIDGHSQPGRWSGLMSAGRSAVGYSSVPQNDAGVVLRDGHVVLTVTSVPWPSLVLSPDGTKVAWVELVQHGTVGRIVLRDLDTGRDLGTLPVEARLVTVDSDAQVRVFRVDNDGSVLYGDLGTWHTWRPGHAIGAAVRAEHTALDPGFPVRANPLWLSPDESWGAWLSSRSGKILPWDGMGERRDGVTLQRPGASGTRHTIQLPVGTNATALVWESPTDLLVTISDPDLNSPWHYLRCSVVDRRCEQAPTGLDD